MHPHERLFRINRKIDGWSVPYNVNEQQIESLLAELEKTVLPNNLFFWLTMARLTEAVLLCAGHYADNCEFSAAGDLLLNPRKIHLHVPGCNSFLVKERHGRLTDQLNRLGGAPRYAKKVTCEIVAPALLPYLHGRLAQSDFFSADYIDDVAIRMLQIADTLTFLAAYQTFSNEALYEKLKSAGKREKRFIESHLCRFSADPYLRLQRQVDRLLVNGSSRETLSQVMTLPQMGAAL